MKVEPLTRCPGCHHASARLVPVGDHTLRRCIGCGLTYAPEAADPDDIYVEGYFSGEVGAFGLDTRHPHFREFLEWVGDRRMDIIEHVVKPPGRILDVGCGTGETLSRAKARGWEAVGVDLVPDAVKIAREDFGLEVQNSFLEESGLPERSFDVVLATHVLEHQRDGAAFLRTLAQWATPGGHVVIEVPNWRSTDRWRNDQRWNGLRPLEHLGHYGPKTLAKTMRGVGLEPRYVRTPCYLYDQQTLGQALVGLGLLRLDSSLERFTYTIERHGQPVHLPNARLRLLIEGAGWLTDHLHVGVVVVMVARVPLTWIAA